MDREMSWKKYLITTHRAAERRAVIGGVFRTIELLMVFAILVKLY